MHTRAHTRASTQARTRTHNVTNKGSKHALCKHVVALKFTCCILCVHGEAGDIHPAHSTPIFYVPVSAKKGSLRPQMSRAFTTLPPSLQCWKGDYGGVCRLRKKIPFLRRRTCTTIPSTLKRPGKGRRIVRSTKYKGNSFSQTTA